MEDKRNTESVVQEIMGLVDDVLGCDSAGYQFECKRQIQSKLRELVERCSVREPLSDEHVLSMQERYVGGVCPQYPLDASDWINFARAIELAHNITNTTKE